MADLTRETMPTADARRPLVPVDVPVLGGTLYVRVLSAGQATALPEKFEAFLGAVLLQSVVYADGSPVWETEAQAMAYPMDDLKPLIAAAMDVNGMSDKGVEERKGN